MLRTIAAFDRIGEENAFAVLARANALIAQGRDIINLGIGQPDFRTPEHIGEAAIKAIRDGHHGCRAEHHKGRGRDPGQPADSRCQGYLRLPDGGRLDRQADEPPRQRRRQRGSDHRGRERLISTALEAPW